MQNLTSNLVWSNNEDFQRGWKDYVGGNTRLPNSVNDPLMWRQGYTAAKKSLAHKEQVEVDYSLCEFNKE